MGIARCLIAGALLLFPPGGARDPGPDAISAIAQDDETSAVLGLPLRSIDLPPGHFVFVTNDHGVDRARDIRVIRKTDNGGWSGSTADGAMNTYCSDVLRRDGGDTRLVLSVVRAANGEMKLISWDTNL